MLRISLFGPLNVTVSGSPLPALRSRKALWLLALLILRHNRSVQREWLAAALWPDTESSVALANLRIVLSELRRALGDEGLRLKTPDRHTLFIDLSDLDVDVVSFDTAIHDGEISALSSAVEVYKGPLLEGCNEEWVHQERAIREQDCLSALEKLGKSSMGEGDFKSAVAWYRKASLIDPWWDTAQRGLMEALTKSGDINEALQVYRAFDSLLRADSHATPDEETTALYLRLRAEVRKRSHTQEAKSPAPSVTGQLPHPLTQLVGREDERIEVVALLRRNRLVTLTGFGGIGKTRLALDIATEIVGEYPDGVWLVPLESLMEPSLVPRQIASAFELGENPNLSDLDILSEHLRQKRILLVLDNCEHILASVASTATHLLQKCGGLRILATSREPMGVIGELAWSVPPLAVPDTDHLPRGSATLQRVLMEYEAIRLFVERACEVRREFAMNASNALTIAEVCSALEGIPLAIELTAARVRTLSIDQISQRLFQDLGGRNSGAITVPRHQTLRTTISWSYNLLSQEEKTLLGRLSIFADGWTLESAEDICSDSTIPASNVGHLLTSLIDKSLVQFHEKGERFRLLDMVKQYVAENLQDHEKERLQSRHLAWMIKLAEESETQLRGPAQQVWMQLLNAETANLRAAIALATGEESLRITSAMARFWYIRGDFREGRACLEQALRQPGDRVTLARAKALYGLGILAYRQSDHDVAQTSHEESLMIRRELGDQEGIAESLLNLANVASSRIDYGTAETLYIEALALSVERGDQRQIALILGNLGTIKIALGQNREARGHLEESLGLNKLLGDKFHLGWNLHNLGILAGERGDYRLGRSYIEECLPMFQELGERRGVAWALHAMGDIARKERNHESAKMLYDKSLTTLLELGDRHGQACCIHQLGVLSLDLGNLKEADSQLNEALAMFHEIGFMHGVGYGLLALATVARLEGNIERAMTLNNDALRTFVDRKESKGTSRSLQEQAMLAVIQKEFEQAAQILGAAAGLREELDLGLSHGEVALFTPLIEKAKEALEEEFEVLFVEGRELGWKRFLPVSVAGEAH